MLRITGETALVKVTSEISPFWKGNGISFQEMMEKISASLEVSINQQCCIVCDLNGSFHLSIDYIKLNDVTNKDALPDILKSWTS